MRARVEADLRLTSTTDSAHRRADRRSGAPAQRIPACRRDSSGRPFFEFQTDGSRSSPSTPASSSASTRCSGRGSRPRWIARTGKLTMAILGHPLYAGGDDMAAGQRRISRALQRLLREHGVTIVMAGDTHDFEYYAEPARRPRAAVHHFVNGGGGAYLSFGTALAWPAAAADAPTGPSTRAATQVVDKIEARHAVVEAAGVVVDEAARRVAVLGRVAVGGLRLQRRAVLPELRRGPRRAVDAVASALLPYGIHGRLRWRDLSISAVLSASAGTTTISAEWVVPMR